MTATLNFACDEAPSRDAADQAIETLVAHVGSLPARLAVPRIAAYRARLDAAEATALATVIGEDGSTKRAETISAKGGKTSSRSRRRTAKRAAAVKQNSSLAKKVADGDISAEHLDVLADAVKKTNGASVTDNDLIAKVAEANPDLGKSIIDKYLLDKGASGEQTRHDRQRRARKVVRFQTKDDCEALMIAGDKATIDAIWNQTTSLANQLFESDGGRKVPLEQHPRTRDQRMFDALTNRLMSDGNTDDAAGATAAPNSSEPGTAASTATEPDPRAGPDGATTRTATPCAANGSDAQPTSKRTTPRKRKPTKTTSRPVIVIGVTLDKYLGLDTRQAAELIGSGPVADSVLAQYLGADPDIIGAIYGTNGQPLWIGHNVRLATKAQHLALILRDKNCVLCGAAHTRCRAHHIQPANAPERGPTDITNLVLVCDSCHHFIHDNLQTIYQDRTTSQWKLRAALPHEIPPPRPGHGEAPMRT